MRKERFNVTGMTCSACSSRVEKAVSKLDGIGEISVNLLTNSMKAEFDESVLKAEDIIAAVEKAGYGASVFSNEPAADAVMTDTSAERKNIAAEEIGQTKLRLIVSFIFLIPLMYISMGHMIGLPVADALEDVLYGTENAGVYVFTQFLLLLPILYVNRKFFISGFGSLSHGGPNMDTLVGMGAAAATIYGCFALLRICYGLGHGDMEVVHHYSMNIYFESAGTILTLITLGKFLETRSKGKTSEAIEKLIDMAPQTAIVERNGVETEIPVSQVRAFREVLQVRLTF